MEGNTHKHTIEIVGVDYITILTIISYCATRNLKALQSSLGIIVHIVVYLFEEVCDNYPSLRNRHLPFCPVAIPTY